MAGILRTAIPVHGQLVRISATVGAAVGATIGLGVGDPDSYRADPSGPDIDPTDDPVAQVLRRERATELAGLEPAPGHPGTGDLMRFADAALFAKLGLRPMEAEEPMRVEAA